MVSIISGYRKLGFEDLICSFPPPPQIACETKNVDCKMFPKGLQSVQKVAVPHKIKDSEFCLGVVNQSCVSTATEGSPLYENRKVAYSHRAGWHTAFFYCDSLNYESLFIEQKRKHAVSRMKMSAVRESATSLLIQLGVRYTQV